MALPARRRMYPNRNAAPPATATSGSDTSLQQLVQMFEESEEGTQTAREKSERDRDYYDHKQWTDAELTTLNKRKQPALVINRIQRKIDYLRGMERRMRTDPKALPRTPKHEQDAASVTDALRFVADQNTFDVTASETYENKLVEGTGGCEVTCDVSANPPRVTIQNIPWDRIFADPHSRLRDYSDAKYIGVVIWMDKPDALAMFKGREEAIEQTFSGQSISDTYDDRPKHTVWSDNRRTRLRIVQMYYQQPGGEWWVCTFTKGGHLTDPQPSPWLDEQGKPECPIVLDSAYVDRDNNRYGVVRSMISLQDEINKRRSKALHLLSVRQVRAEKGAVIDVNAARRELAKPDGFVETTPNKVFEVLQTGDFAAGQMALLTHATQEMDLAGPNASMAGKDSRDQSGRAIIAQQQGGAIEVEPLNDGHRQWKRRVFTQVWHRIRQFWTAEVWVRVTDDERNLRWVGLNRQITLGDRLSRLAPEMQAAYMRQNGIGPGDPRLGQVIGVENEIAQLDVDVQVEEGPDISTIQGEEFAQLAELAKAGMQIPPDAIISASSLRNKDAILKRMGIDRSAPPEEMDQQRQQAQEMAGKAAQLELATKEAQARKAEADAVKAEAEAMKAQAEAQGMGVPTEPTAPQLDPLKVRELDLKEHEINTRADLEREKIAAAQQAKPEKPMMDDGMRSDLNVLADSAAGKTQQIVDVAMDRLAQTLAPPLAAIADGLNRNADATAQSGDAMRAGLSDVANMMGAEQELIIDPKTQRPVGSRRKMRS